MTTDTPDTYNGWANRETWAVALYINNDQGWQESVHHALRSATLDNAVPLATAIHAGDVRQLAAYRAGLIISENVADYLDVDNYGGDLDSFARGPLLAIQDIGSMWRVDWTELGASFLTDVAEASDN